MTVKPYQQFEMIPPQQNKLHLYFPFGMLLHFKHAINIPQGMHYHALLLTIWWIQGSYFVKITFIMRAREKLGINQTGYQTRIYYNALHVEMHIGFFLGSGVSLAKVLCY